MDERPDPLGTRFKETAADQLFVEMLQSAGDEYWERVRCLHTRGGREVFEAALAALNGSDGIRRRTGADVLAQLGSRDGKPFADESIPYLLARLQDSHDEDALVGIAGALHHLGYGEDHGHRRLALSRLRQLSEHPDGDVREAVVSAVNAVVDGPEPLSLEAVLLLCELSGDRARDVRDWATFWLEELPAKGFDLPEVRAALWARVHDEDEEIRVQAINGLANHGDRSVLPFLMEELVAELVDEDALMWLGALEAASTLADPISLPVLRRLLPIMKEQPWIDDCAKAIAACERQQ